MGGDGVVYYRTVADYRRVRALAVGKHVAVLGGGFIGSEIAASLATAGYRVTLLFPEEGIGARLFPRELAVYLNGYYTEREVEVCREAGRAMAGADAGYRHLPFFYSDLFDLGYEATGVLDPRLEVVADWKEPLARGGGIMTGAEPDFSAIQPIGMLTLAKELAAANAMTPVMLSGDSSAGPVRNITEPCDLRHCLAPRWTF